MANQTRDKSVTLNPKQALELLVEGNLRFTQKKLDEHDRFIVQKELQDAQYPFASVLGCSDSRTTPEFIFDQNHGDIFSVRLAGNIATKEAIGSLEFSTEYLGAKIVVVLGHSSCGAVKAACDHFKGGNIGEVIDSINSSVEAEKTIDNQEERNSQNNSFVDKVCALNVHTQMQKIIVESSIIQNQIEKQQVGIVGAVYSLASGQVHFDIENAIF